MKSINSEIFNLPKVPFTVPKLQQIYKECNDGKENDDNVNKTNLINNFIKLTSYVTSYYYEKSNYLFYDVTNDIFKMKEKKDFISEVVNKCDESLYKLLFQKNNKIYSIVSKIHKPRLFKDGDNYFINECRGFLHSNHKPYNEYSKETQRKTKIMLDYIKEISCGGDETFFNCYCKYLSQVCSGIRTEVIIYKKTMQGSGKSTESDFMMQYVLGDAVSINSGSEPLLTPYNKALLGKIYVVFEELPVFSQAQWSGVSSTAKKFATNPRLDYRTLHESPINAENVSNLVINTNCESIKDSNGRRIIIMPVNNSKMEDHIYFGHIRDNCFNMVVGECFYAYMKSLNIDGFYAQKEFPETDAKRIAISELLPSHMKFLKFEYYLKNKSIINKLPQDLYNEYVYFCPLNNIKHTQTKNNFYKDLKADLKIEPHKSGVMRYNVTYETLSDLALRFKWICQYDEFSNDEFIDIDEDVTSREIKDDDTDITHELGKDYTNWKDLYLNLEKEMNKLKDKMT